MEGVVCGQKLVVIDTPGICDTSRPEKDLEYALVSCLTACAPGPHAFVLVLEVDRYTKENRESVKKIWDCFGEEARKHTIVLFTHGDKLDKGMTIHDFLEDDLDQRRKSLKTNGKKVNSETIKSVVEECGNRVHVIDNKHWKKRIVDQHLLQKMERCGLSEAQMQELTCMLQADLSTDNKYRSNDFQVSELIRTICSMAAKNGGCYTNPVLQKLAEAIRAEVEKIKAELEEAGEKQDMGGIRRRARERVRNRALRKLAGVGTGVLMGAFLGLAVTSTLPVVLVTGLLTAIATQLAVEFNCPPGGDKLLLSKGKELCAAIPAAVVMTNTFLKNSKDFMKTVGIGGEWAG